MVDKPASRSRPPKLLDQMREALRYRHYSRRTEQTYCQWVKRYIRFHHVRHPAEMAEPEINAFLTHLAVKEKVSASTQNQAFSALLFLYRHVLGREIGDLGKVIRACKPTRLPVVMTRDEVKAVLVNLSGDKWLMASLMYGAGLRLMECLRLRVQDIDFSRNEIIVRDGKGAKDRVTMLPESIKAPLLEHLKRVKSIHERDLGGRLGAVCRCLMHSTASIPTLQPNGAGNGFSLRKTDGATPRPAKRDGITSMSRLCRRRCVRRWRGPV
jgi:site-specific recombinase XerD